MLTSIATTLTLLLSLHPPPSHSWGTLGHRTTTAVALSHFPNPAHPVHQLLHTLLHGQDPTLASLFPDRIRYIPRFAYTAPWHYIDSLSIPPATCSIDLTRDCPDSDPAGCVITAIANHTSRVADINLPDWERGQSLRFMLHFFGDVHMPLHTVGWQRGGNEVPVLFGGVKTNVHSVWDTLIAKRIVGVAGEEGEHNLDMDVAISEKAKYGFATTTTSWDPTNETEAAYAWANFLYHRYTSLPEPTEDGRVCTSDAADCALEWARESNRWVCDYVLRDGVEGLHGKDLAGEYFEGAVPIVEELVFRGGRRLAAWLDVVARRIGKRPWVERVDDDDVDRIEREL